MCLYVYMCGAFALEFPFYLEKKRLNKAEWKRSPFRDRIEILTTSSSKIHIFVERCSVPSDQLATRIYISDEQFV